MAVTVSVTVRQVREDGSEAPADGELAAALAGSAEREGASYDSWDRPAIPRAPKK